MNFIPTSRRIIPWLIFSFSLGCGVEAPGELEGAEATEISQEAKHGGGNTVAPCTLKVESISPSTLYPGYSNVVLSGVGFIPNDAINWVIGSTAHFAVADATGYSSSFWSPRNGNTYTFFAKEYYRRGYETCGSITFTLGADGSLL